MQVNQRLMFEDIARFRDELTLLETEDSPFVTAFRDGTRIALFFVVTSVFASSLYDHVRAGGSFF